MLKKYFEDIFETAQTGDAREESFYTDLKNLLETYADKSNLEDFHVTVLPKKSEGGYPDFKVWSGTQERTGHIEAKKPSIENLRKVENSKQLKRYRDTFPNLILTNFLEFRLYRDGNLIDKIMARYLQVGIAIKARKTG